MSFRQLLALAILFGLGSVARLHAEDSAFSDELLGTAIRKAIPLLEKGSAGSAEQRTCFTCHNQALPVLALTAAKQRGFEVDEQNLKRQIDHTFAHLERGRENYLKGKGQGGRVITAGYALWALETAEHKPDEVTAAVASFLLQYQGKSDHWRHPGNRPPSSGSDFATTYIALRGLTAFGTVEQADKIEGRTDAVREWLFSAEPKDTEDHVFRLRALKYANVDEEVLQKASKALMETQREDGGWAQTGDMESDAYATATAVVGLIQAGGVPLHDQTIEWGLRYLLDTQLEDGSWHVVTRAKPFQTYFESGFPHEKDQFISIAASSWATLALVLACAPKETAVPNSDVAVAELRKLGAKIRFDEQGRVVEVNLQESKTKDEDLVHLAGLRDLTDLSLHQTKVTSAGLIHLKQLIKLEKLYLTDTKIDDAGLKHLGALRNLKILGLSGTAVGDAGLENLKELGKLESLFMIGAKVTDPGVEKLKAALPACDIVY